MKTTAWVGDDTQDVVQRRKPGGQPGGQPGNRNAFRTGHDTAKLRVARSEIGKLKRSVRETLLLAKAVLKTGGR